MMGIFDRNAHLLKRQNRITTKIGRIIKRRQVEIASPVDRVGRRRILEAEILHGRADVDCIPKARGLFQHLHEDMAGIGTSRLAVRRVDVAEHACNAIIARAPRKHLECGRFGMSQHVAVLDARKPVDRRPIESDALFECRVDIRWGNGYVLEVSQNVDEPKTKKADVAALRSA